MQRLLARTCFQQKLERWKHHAAWSGAREKVNQDRQPGSGEGGQHPRVCETEPVHGGMTNDE
jgi:hypothetical protein